MSLVGWGKVVQISLGLSFDPILTRLISRQNHVHLKSQQYLEMGIEKQRPVIKIQDLLHVALNLSVIENDQCRKIV